MQLDSPKLVKKNEVYYMAILRTRFKQALIVLAHSYRKTL